MMSGFPVSLDLMALKATCILMGAMLVAFALRRASGNSRHTLWTATTLALLALPLLESNLPRLPLAWLPAAPDMGQVLSAEPVASANVPVAGAFAPGAADRLVETAGALGESSSPAPRGLGFWLGTLWALGVIGFAAPVLLGVLRSRRVMATAREVTDDRLRDHFAHASRLVGVQSPVSLRISPAVRTPMTGGLMHPVVLLPETALLWSDECTAAVLRHELVHVRQRDALRQLGSRLSVALYWFHPLAWRAARLGALAREMACDESVLRLGTRPSRYARHLLALADPLPAPAAPALVRLDHPHLEERVMAILRASPPPASRRLSISAALLIAAWTAVVAAATPVVREAVADDRTTATTEFPVEYAPNAPELHAGVEMPVDAPVLAESIDLEQQADCEPSRDGRVSATRDARGGVRMFTTTHEGTRICFTVRGDNADRAVFVPRGRLPNGVLVTMATSNSDGERRLEIEGTSSGNQHRWFVDGRDRNFDGEAAQWRDAMFELIGVLTERSNADRARAVEAMGVARRDLERSRVAMGRSLGAEEAALARAHASAEVAARLADRVASRPVRVPNVEARARIADARARELGAAGRAMGRDAEAMAEVAEAHARAAADVARHMDEVTAVGVGGSAGGRAMVAPHAAGGGRAMIAPRAAGGRSLDRTEMRVREMEALREHTREALDEHRRTMELQREDLDDHAEELRAHARELAREHARMAEELQREMPVVGEGRSGVRMRDVPAAPRAPRDVPAPRALRQVPRAPSVPTIREREDDPRAREAAERLRQAIRVTGET